MGPGDYIRGVVHRWWIIVVLVLLAAGGALAVTRNTVDMYTASIDITVPSNQSGTSGANGQYVENFAVALTSASVVAEVANKTGESTTDLSDNLAASQLGNSSFIEVSYTSSVLAKARTVASVATTTTATVLELPAIQTSTTLLSSAQKALTAARTRVDAEQKALDSFTAAHGRIDPNVLYQAAQSSLTQLSVSRQQAIAQGRGTSNFDSAIASARRQLESLAPHIGQYNALSRQLNQAELAGQTAQSRVVSASEQLAAAQAAPLIGAVSASTETAKTKIVKSVLIAAGIAFVLGIALALLLTALRGATAPSARARKRDARRAARRSRDAGTDLDPHPAPNAPEHRSQPQRIG